MVIFGTLSIIIRITAIKSIIVVTINITIIVTLVNQIKLRNKNPVARKTGPDGSDKECSESQQVDRLRKMLQSAGGRVGFRRV